MESLGTILKERREAQRLSLDELAGRTRIRACYLQAMEADDFDSLPGKGYVVGFLRIYAVALGLDSEGLVEQYRQERGEPLKPSFSLEGPPLTGLAEPQQTSQKSSLGPIVGILLVVLLIGGTLFLLLRQPAPEPPMVAVQIPLATAAGDPPTEGAPLPPATATADGADKPQEEPATAEKMESKRVPVIQKSGSGVRIVALQQTSLTLSIDGGEPRKYDLKAGAALSWRAQETVRFVMDDPSAVEIFCDGNPVANLSAEELILVSSEDVAVHEGDSLEPVRN